MGPATGPGRPRGVAAARSRRLIGLCEEHADCTFKPGGACRVTPGTIGADASRFSLDDLYRAANVVEPGFIRVEAGEATHCRAPSRGSPQGPRYGGVVAVAVAGAKVCVHQFG